MVYTCIYDNDPNVNPSAGINHYRNRAIRLVHDASLIASESEQSPEPEPEPEPEPTWARFCMDHWNRYCWGGCIATQRDTPDTLDYEEAQDRFLDYLYLEIDDEGVYTMTEETFCELPDERLLETFNYWRTRRTATTTTTE